MHGMMDGKVMDWQVAGGDGGVYSRMGEWVSASSLPHWGKQMCRYRACSESLMRDTMDLNNYDRARAVRSHARRESMISHRDGLWEIWGAPWEERKHEKGESPAPPWLPHDLI